jgi:hypothetical protein
VLSEPIEPPDFEEDEGQDGAMTEEELPSDQEVGTNKGSDYEPTLVKVCFYFRLIIRLLILSFSIQ